jgi:outer membrane biosynthesis protein TonB
VLLLHKEEVICKQHGMSARVTGTVVVVIEIDRTGKVSFAKAISGPAMLIPPALNAVRKYQYKPYTLNDKPVSVETTVAIPFECPNQ